ncbi:MAG: hypothetical protein ACREQA_03800 [Candidatus Binatia bacterium]
MAKPDPGTMTWTLAEQRRERLAVRHYLYSRGCDRKCLWLGQICLDG